jgi:hypothetical protein
MNLTQNMVIPQIEYPATLMVITINGHEITRDLRQTIRQARHEYPVFKYLQTKYKWHYSTIHNIDWELHDQILQ